MIKLRFLHTSCLSFFLATTTLPVSTLAAWNDMPYNSMGFNPMTSGMGMPGAAGFSPWSMGGASPWSSGFSPWSMGGGSNPWSSGFSPWNMGGNSPWNGNGWNSSMWPWGNNGSGGNSWGNNSWMPWSNNSSFLGRRNNNNDWVTSMFLMNSLNNQQPAGMGMPPSYPYQAPSWNQGFVPPAVQPPQAITYPQLAAPTQLPNAINPMVGQVAPAASSMNFPPSSSSFSPFLNDPVAPASGTTDATVSAGQQPIAPLPQVQAPGKTLVFPDGTSF